MIKLTFRGYSKNLNCWLYGDLINTPDNKHFIITYSGSENDYQIIKEEVEKDSIGVNTGVFDSKKIPIYSGDILYFFDDTDDTYEITFKSGSFGYYGIYDYIALPDANTSETTITDNIYERKIKL